MGQDTGGLRHVCQRHNPESDQEILIQPVTRPVLTAAQKAVLLYGLARPDDHHAARLLARSGTHESTRLRSRSPTGGTRLAVHVLRARYRCNSTPTTSGTRFVPGPNISENLL